MFYIFNLPKKEISIQTNLMARTKQTARCAIVQNNRTGSKGGKGGKGSMATFKKRRGSRSPSPDSEEENEQINNQQFSVKFDDQPACEQKSLKYSIIECKNCHAFLSSFSKMEERKSEPALIKRPLRSNKMSDAENQMLSSVNGTEKLWICEFCLTQNIVPLDFVQPSIDNACYLIDQAHKGNVKGKAENNDQLIIYCIDVSGSMDMQVEGKSRLNAVKEAISDEIKRMKFEKEKVKIGIITFGSLVTLYSKQNINVDAKLYFNFEGITNFCDTIPDITLSIDKSFPVLKKNVDDLSTYGSTALGPAVVAAIQMASKGKKGAKIILCTDGEANQGLVGAEFYNKAASYAKEKGVVINILSLKGDNCNLKELGKLSLSTRGSLMKIDPKLLGTQFNKVSKEVLYGTESKLRIIVSRLMEIENVDPKELSPDKTIFDQDYGNFTKQTELTFNFKVLTKEEATAKGISLQLYNRPRAPMQVQLTYRSPTGAKYLQVITDYRELSQNAADLFKEMNFGLFGASVIQKVSKFIREAKYSEAEEEIKKYRSLVQEVFIKSETKEKIDKFGTKIDELQKIVNSKQSKSKDRSKPTKMKAPKAAKKQKKLKKRNRNRSVSCDSNSSNSRSRSNSGSNHDVLSSDEEQQILIRGLRFRSRSRSASP